MKLKRVCTGGVKKVLRSKLNGGNVVGAIKTLHWVISLVKY